MERQQLEQARKLIGAKQYEDARALLITIDHPIAEKWLDRLNSIPAAAVGTAPDYTSKAVVMIVLYFILFIPGLLAGDIWSRQAKRDLKKYTEVPGAKLVINMHATAMTLLIGALVFMLALVIISTIQLGAR